ncbi:hypothetical protein AGDE_14860 [Angomonas deanei]|uniref:Thymine dioxygenase JBP1 DNA-binding domain containing protein, putative n=1 Tax=Angomonas deanei TaxID=59799 RepID=A0A7G2C2W3_9TRYP|nr:hypothetical protein AGDE_14860 [Angomonas deanei]CAD2214118.1 Thymine dioxygenase JBP1 DNA-binding domain containing protein, putative [Angomonas deanei]|eukprot:EPY20098.1 hypothetical protein AGDE_14860 [Angomonas deanei]
MQYRALPFPLSSSSDMSSSTTTSSTSTDSSPTSSSSSSDGDNRPRENNNGGGQVAPLAKNPSLQFEKPDHEYIPLPNVRDERTRNRLLRVFLLDRTRYPERRHRMLDYFRASVEMFVHQVVVENVEQSASAAKHGRQHTRFIWKNKGELAICFACCCDMLKLFYDTIQPSPIKPVWDAFVKQFAQFAIEESKIPTSILDEKTYNIKYLDWQKGGTRYVGESASNVRFPSVQERRVKVETYLRSGEGYTLQAVQVAVSDTVSVVPPRTTEHHRPPVAGRCWGGEVGAGPAVVGGGAAEGDAFAPKEHFHRRLPGTDAGGAAPPLLARRVGSGEG